MLTQKQVNPVLVSYRTNQRSTPEGAKVNVEASILLPEIFNDF